MKPLKLASPKARNRALIKIFVVAAVGMAAWGVLRESKKIEFEAKSEDGMYRCTVVTTSSLMGESKTKAQVYRADVMGKWSMTSETEFGDPSKGKFAVSWETDFGVTTALTLKQLDGAKVVMVMRKQFVEVKAATQTAPATSASATGN